MRRSPTRWIRLSATAAAATVTALLPALAADAHAQDRVLPEPGAWLLRTTVPDGGGSLAVGRWIGPATSLGLDVAFSATGGGTEADGVEEERPTRWATVVGVEGRRYVEPSHRIAPFLLGRIDGGWSGGDADGSRSLAAAVGIGAEWYPAPNLSLGAWTGLRVGTDRFESAVGDESWRWSVASRVSELQLGLAF